jgi:dUTPase
MSCRFLSDHQRYNDDQRLDHDYCEDTDTEQIGGVHNLIRSLIQYADTDTVIGYGDRIGQMIMSGPAFGRS